MSSSVGSSSPCSIFHTRDWTILIRLAKALPDNPAAVRREVSRAASALRLTLSDFGAGIVKMDSLLREVALEVRV
jgi:hypothetical protein